MTTSSSSAPYLFVHPRVDRRSGAHGDRRRSERFVARIGVEIRSNGLAYCETIDVSRSGFLAAVAALVPLRQPLMLTLALPDGPLHATGVVVRHTQVAGRPAVAVQLLGLSRAGEERWLRAVAALAEARHAEDLVARDAGATQARPLRVGEYFIARDTRSRGG